jgi:hypothetical protein
MDNIKGGISMADNNSQTEQSLLKPDARLKSLNRLVGLWNVDGDRISGTVNFEWLEGGFFLVQKVDLIHDRRKIKGIEYIGFEQGWEEMQQTILDSSNKDITSHYFDNQGYTFTYTWEIEEDTLTIWGGTKGSPSKYLGKFSEDGNSNSGAWAWPGGGYESTMTRVK